MVVLSTVAVMTEERHPVRQNDPTDVLVGRLSDMFDSQSTL